jgi:hypothetical protein
MQPDTAATLRDFGPPAAASKFLLTSSVGTTITADSPFDLTVTVVDAYNNTVTSYVGTVKFTDSLSGATLPVNYTFTSGSGKDNGVHTFTGLVLNTKGTQTLKVIDTKTSSLLGSLVVSVI